MAALSWNEIKSRAVAFSKEWENETYEDGEAKSFLDAFFNVFGVSRRRFVKYERRVVAEDGTEGYIDSIWKGVILVEMKSRGKSLDKAYNQARGYFFSLTDSELPRYVLVSDFQFIRLYDLDSNLQWEFPLKELVKKVRLFGFLAGYQQTEIKEQDPVNIKAAEQMGRIHDELKELGYHGHQLELYLVRILFCMFADDTTLFNKSQFYEYISKSREDGSDLAMCLAQLFEVLNTREEERLKNLPEDLASFPYVNGQLFEEQLHMANFTSRMREQLLNCCRLDWGQVSPAIFGSMFQSVMKASERRSLGAHYTSEENIHKVINPLFLDDLKAEFVTCRTSKKKLEDFHNKIANLKFLDPACGCGNFLIISYKELRMIEIDVLKILLDNRQLVEVASYAKVNVDQFYGIELEEFPAQIAQVAMWLMDHQMNMKMSEEFGLYYVRLPLRAKANITIGNALQIEWKSIASQDEISFILGNPPFVGSSMMDENQKLDMRIAFKDFGNTGQLDYVTAWYIKASDFLQKTDIKVGFVSTNSICQGEQAITLWPFLMQNRMIDIFFAHQTFNWTNEAPGNANVNVIIVGFKIGKSVRKSLFTYNSYDSDPSQQSVSNINQYLQNSPTVFIKTHVEPICNVPPMLYGTKPTDGGNYIFTEEEMKRFIESEPKAAKYFVPFIGAEDMIQGYRRYCLYLKNCPMSEIFQMPHVRARVQNVAAMRKGSKKIATQKMVNYPTLLGEDRYSPTDMLVIPSVSSENREYVPVGYYKAPAMCNNSSFQISNADYYTFGVFVSRMHMAWMKTVCGRLESRYRYSNTIVYNNFPWPNSTLLQKKQIEDAVKDLLRIRESKSTQTLAQMYSDPMDVEVRRAHEKIDGCVEKAYGRRFNSDADRVAYLFERYAELTSG